MSTMLPSGGSSFYRGSDMYGVQSPEAHDSEKNVTMQSIVNSYLGIPSNANPDANNAYLNLYNNSGKKEYLEKYLDNIIARENLASAQAYDERMSSTQFRRAIEDIKAAGYNPWLAISGAGASYSSPGSAGNTTTNASAGISSRRASNTKTAATLVSSALMVAALIVKAVI